ncbi:MAG: Gfo/Idh/MocA family oxidoreductase [Armatimonadetes bacterium]|nr:Gfo/Idh/MocA family oxidoreductase [Armatimonadota bacterium]
MSKPKLTVGLIGYQFMGKAHSNAYRQVGRFFDLPMDVRMKTLCGRNQAGVEAAANVFGWETTANDWRKVIEDPEIDVIDIATPGNTHCEIAVAAAEAGKIVFCEKPIGNSLVEAEKIAAAVAKSGRPSLVYHNYRATPAIALAKKMIASGQLGEIFHIRAHYLQDWIIDPEFPLVWRLNRDIAGSGTLGDLAAHSIDTARYLVGEFQEVCGMLHTFIKDRPLVGEIDDKMGATPSTERGEVTVDDASIFMARLGNGTLGTFEASRFSTGRKNYNRFEINGSKGAVVFNFERMNELEYYNNEDPEGTQGFRFIQATEGHHPYAGHYWPVGHIIGYEHTFINLIADAVTALAEGREPSPNMQEGLANQRVLDAVERSHTSRGWVSL